MAWRQLDSVLGPALQWRLGLGRPGQGWSHFLSTWVLG